jgi:hypothetical protein
MCYRTIIMRTGQTRTTSFSLDEITRSNLKRLADRRHGGNVSALIAELATREVRLAAAEAFFEKNGVPPLSDERAAQIEVEWLNSEPGPVRRRQSAKAPKTRRRRPA